MALQFLAAVQPPQGLTLFSVNPTCTEEYVCHSRAIIAVDLSDKVNICNLGKP